MQFVAERRLDFLHRRHESLLLPGKFLFGHHPVGERIGKRRQLCNAFLNRGVLRFFVEPACFSHRRPLFLLCGGAPPPAPASTRSSLAPVLRNTDPLRISAFISYFAAGPHPCRLPALALRSRRFIATP